MHKVFIDTSVFIRFLTFDDKQKAQECEQFFKQVEQGKLRPYISNIVILEIQFVLTRLYSFPKNKVLLDIGNLIALRNLTIVEKTDTKKALSLHKKINVKYPDCLISTQIPKDTKVVTYDEDFSKIPGIFVAKPVDF